MKKIIRTIRWGGGSGEIRRDFDSSLKCANYMNIQEAELRWALEEFNRCDTQEVTAWNPTTPSEEYPSKELEVKFGNKS